MRYIEERNKKTLELLDEAKTGLPAVCNRFFLGVSQRAGNLTMLGYAYDLGTFFDFLVRETVEFAGKKVTEIEVEDLDKVEVFHIELFADYLRRDNSPRGISRKLSCLRSFFAYLFKVGLIKRNVLPNVDMPKLHQKNIIRLDDDEADKIVREAETGADLTPAMKRFHAKNGERDATILKFFLSTGCRVSELVGLDVGDIDLKNASFKITRKGGNETVLYMTDDLRDALDAYLRTPVKKTPATNAAPPLQKGAYPPSNRPLWLNPQGGRLGVRAVENLVKKYAHVAAPLKHISPHKLRSTFGTNLYRATGDIYVVADVLGHQNVNTTKKHYAEITADIKKSAMQQFQNRK